MCSGLSVSLFESVEAVLQVLVGVASLLVAPKVGVVSTLGVLKNGLVEAFSVSPSELPLIGIRLDSAVGF